MYANELKFHTLKSSVGTNMQGLMPIHYTKQHSYTNMTNIKQTAALSTNQFLKDIHLWLITQKYYLTQSTKAAEYSNYLLCTI